MIAKSFEGQRIVITGGGSGIGLALARDLVECGAAAVVLTGRDEAKLQSAATELGPTIETATFDLSDESAVASFFDAQPPLDHIVTAAAGTVRGTVVELEVAKARAVFETKFWGQYYCCKYGAGKLVANGSVVLFSGFPGRKPMAGISTLAAIDGAIEALCRTLTLEIAPRRVNTIVPGMINTPLWSSRLTAAEQRDYFQEIGADLPAGRGGTAEDVASACRFVMENGFMTGAIIDVDGGQR